MRILKMRYFFIGGVIFFCIVSFPYSIHAAMISRLTVPINSNTSLVVLKDSNGVEKKNLIVSDYLSSTRSILAEDGTITNTPSYYPYGSSYTPGVKDAPTPGVNAITNRFYTGQRKVSDTDNIYNYNARYYNPDIGVFTQPDTVEGINRYAYVSGNPIMRNDPSGNMSTGSEAYGGGRNLWSEKRPSLATKIDMEVADMGVYSIGSLADRALKTVSGIGYNLNGDWFALHQQSLEPYYIRDEFGRRPFAGTVMVGGFGALNSAEEPTLAYHATVYAQALAEESEVNPTAFLKASRALSYRMKEILTRQAVYRENSGLPPITDPMRIDDPVGYIGKLRAMIANKGIAAELVSSDEHFAMLYGLSGGTFENAADTAAFIHNNPRALLGAGYDVVNARFLETSGGVDLEKIFFYRATSSTSMQGIIGSFEHELYHGLDPRLSILGREFRAYVATALPGVLVDPQARSSIAKGIWGSISDFKH